jgi:hypothetical protein
MSRPNNADQVTTQRYDLRVTHSSVAEYSNCSGISMEKDGKDQLD